MSHANVYTDGACVNQGNPNAQAGYGVFWGDNSANNRSGRVDGHQDSNRAELRAAHVAIKTASDNGYAGITIHSDSQFVRDAVNGAGNFQSASANHRDLMQSINDLARHSNIKVNVEYVPAHSGQHGNDQAHRLANAGARGN